MQTSTSTRGDGGDSFILRHGMLRQQPSTVSSIIQNPSFATIAQTLAEQQKEKNRLRLFGNKEGKMYVWELQSSPPVLIAKLSHVQSKAPIRQTAVSFDGSTILGCSENGMIYRWDATSNSIK